MKNAMGELEKYLYVLSIFCAIQYGHSSINILPQTWEVAHNCPILPMSQLRLVVATLLKANL